MRNDERRKRRAEQEAERKRRETRALVFLGVALVVAVVLALTLRFVAEALGATTAQTPENELLDETALALDVQRAENAELERRVRRQARRLRRQRANFRYALRASTVGNDWLERAFLCIYSYERGADGWRTRTGNGYDGGLQMDRTFQREHGARFLSAFGPAYRWPRSVQIAVGIDAWTTRGFQPWPNTARECGLL